MGVSLPAQVSSLLYSLLLGIAAALLYDLLRAVRMRRKRLRLLSEVLDVLYCVFLAALCFFFSLRIGGGELRIYMLLGALLGAVFYFALLAALFRPLWDFWAETLFALLRLLRLPFRFLKMFYGKLTKLCKRLFLFSENCFIIKLYGRSARRARRRIGQKEELVHGSKAKKAHQSAHHRRHTAAAHTRRRSTSAHAGQDRGGGE